MEGLLFLGDTAGLWFLGFCSVFLGGFKALLLGGYEILSFFSFFFGFQSHFCGYDLVSFGARTFFLWFVFFLSFLSFKAFLLGGMIWFLWGKRLYMACLFFF